MISYKELYASHSNNSQEIKDNAIAYGNSSYILIDTENPNYVNKFYIDGYKVYGEKAIQCTIYADGFKNEVAMYTYANQHNLTYVSNMISYDTSKVSIKLTYLRNYITLRKYFQLRNRLSSILPESDTGFSSRNNYDTLFKALIKLLNTMKNDNFVHNNLTLDNIMIHTDNMDLKVVNLKSSYIFNPSYHKDNAIFTFVKNDLFYTLYKINHPQEKDIFMKYFKYKLPFYYRDNTKTKVGDFYRTGLTELFNESFENAVFIEDEEIQIFVKNISFFHLYVNLLSRDVA